MELIALQISACIPLILGPLMDFVLNRSAVAGEVNGVTSVVNKIAIDK
jgi:hypothetical protein